MKRRRPSGPSVQLPPLTPDDFGIPHGRVFTPTMLARYFSCSVETIHRLIQDGQIHALRLRGRGEVRIPYVEVVRFFERQQQWDEEEPEKE